MALRPPTAGPDLFSPVVVARLKAGVWLTEDEKSAYPWHRLSLEAVSHWMPLPDAPDGSP